MLAPRLLALAALALLQACHEDSDDPLNHAPGLTVDFPAADGITDQGKIMFRGTVSDADGDAITGVGVLGPAGELLVDASVTAGEWTAEVTFPMGAPSLATAPRT